MKLLIVGGVAGGAAAAARYRRLDELAEIIMFEKGENISFANCGLPYYAGGIIKERDSLLLQTPASFSKRFNIDVRINNEVVSINPKDKNIRIKDLKKGLEYVERYDKLIISPGAKPVLPGFEGIDLEDIYTIHTLPDIDRLKAKLDSGSVKKAVIIGSGFIGVEMAENIKLRNIDVVLRERLDQVTPAFHKDMAVILHRELESSGIHIILSREVTAIKKSSGYIVETKSGDKVTCDIIIISIGVMPETKLFKDAGLNIGKTGVSVNNRMQTNNPDIYAIGDAVETLNPLTGQNHYIPLAGPAAKQALVVANNIFGIDDTYNGTYGTLIVNVFSLTAGMSGLSEKILKASGIKYEKIYTHTTNHAAYYPGASQMSIKTLFDPVSGKLLGAQIIGKDGVDKKTDIFALAIKNGLTMNALAEAEFSYAPPYGTVKDAINFIGMAAQNHVNGLSGFTHWDRLTGEEFLLDVRTPAEFKRGSVPGSVNIPLDELRERINEIPKNKKTAVFCQSSVRAHNAVRILMQNGYDAYNLSGSYATYINYRDANLFDKS
ncbi:FAD-dependent oxidoreductase [Candidatus Desantisbacteria bacterium]|nr:FAD-dependent oxidoreductase [Candidatus Desantisbacteria bacterium]